MAWNQRLSTVLDYQEKYGANSLVAPANRQNLTAGEQIRFAIDFAVWDENLTRGMVGFWRAERVKTYRHNLMEKEDTFLRGGLLNTRNRSRPEVVGRMFWKSATRRISLGKWSPADTPAEVFGLCRKNPSFAEGALLGRLLAIKSVLLRWKITRFYRSHDKFRGFSD